jgi:hypothetical protein
MEPEAYCHVYNNLPLDPVLSQSNAVHTYIRYSFKVHFNITLTFTPSVLFPLHFPTKIISISHVPHHITCSAQLKSSENNVDKYLVNYFITMSMLMYYFIFLK